MLTTFRLFSLFHVLSLSHYFSHTLSLSEPPLHGETGERKDDVWQLLYFDLLSVRLILTQCVSYQRPVDCVRCVFIHYSGLGHFSQESDNNWCVDLDRESILVAWNESIWSHLGLSYHRLCLHGVAAKSNLVVVSWGLKHLMFHWQALRYGQRLSGKMYQIIQHFGYFVCLNDPAVKGFGVSSYRINWSIVSA